MGPWNPAAAAGSSPNLPSLRLGAAPCPSSPTQESIFLVNLSKKEKQLRPPKPRDHLVLLIYSLKASGISPLPTSPSVFAMLQTLITPPLSYSNVLLAPVFLCSVPAPLLFYYPSSSHLTIPPSHCPGSWFTSDRICLSLTGTPGNWENLASGFYFLENQNPIGPGKLFLLTLQHSHQLAKLSALLWAQAWAGLRCGISKKGNDSLYSQEV